MSGTFSLFLPTSSDRRRGRLLGVTNPRDGEGERGERLLPIPPVSAAVAAEGGQLAFEEGGVASRARALLLSRHD